MKDLRKFYINGEWVDPQGSEEMDVINPATESAIAVITLGSAADVDRAARESLEAAELGDRFGHSVGHGIGLEVHEGPRLYRKSKDMLEAGNVVTVEPGVYLAGEGGVRVEEDVVVV